MTNQNLKQIRLNLSRLGNIHKQLQSTEKQVCELRDTIMDGFNDVNAALTAMSKALAEQLNDTGNRLSAALQEQLTEFHTETTFKNSLPLVEDRIFHKPNNDIADDSSLCVNAKAEQSVSPIELEQEDKNLRERLCLNLMIGKVHPDIVNASKSKVPGELQNLLPKVDKSDISALKYLINTKPAVIEQAWQMYTDNPTRTRRSKISLQGLQKAVEGNKSESTAKT